MAAKRYSALLQCTGKSHFAERAQADAAARRMRGKNKAVNVYRCPHCQFWHIGSRDR